MFLEEVFYKSACEWDCNKPFYKNLENTDRRINGGLGV